jgi:glycolate oxidase FAD binding subunit
VAAVTGQDGLAARLERLLDPGSVERGRARLDGAELPLAAPASEDQASEVVRFAAREALAVVPLGLGSKLGWCRPPARADFLLSTRRLAGIVRHVPEDGTLSARAGTPMDALRRAAREGGHFLTPDVPRPERATLGGVLAAGQSGADRLRFGPARHHVLGTRVLLGDGSFAKSGGQLVKNVTGFDLHRLYCGSHGTLCVLLEAALRLFPEPEHERVVACPAADRDRALELARSALALPIRPVSLTLVRGEGEGTGAAWWLQARLFGRRAPVELESAELLRIWPSAEVVEGPAAREAVERQRDAALTWEDGPWLRATCSTSRLGDVIARLEDELPRELAPRLMAEPGISEVAVLLRPGAFESARALGERAAALRRALAALDARLELRDAPAGALEELDPFGDPPAGLEIMRRLQERLDPGRVFARGRFAAGL